MKINSYGNHHTGKNDVLLLIFHELSNRKVDCCCYAAGLGVSAMAREPQQLYNSRSFLFIPLNPKNLLILIAAGTGSDNHGY